MVEALPSHSLNLRGSLTKKLPKDKMLSVVSTSKEAETWKPLADPKFPLVHCNLETKEFMSLNNQAVETPVLVPNSKNLPVDLLAANVFSSEPIKVSKTI